MKYPDFFNDIQTIILKDELSDFLGTFEDGVVEFSYLDIVKAAGHSCPTVAGAYVMTLVALKELYKDEMPKRGEVFVSFKDDAKDGVAGVVANVVTHITGATNGSGFKGLNKKFARDSLMEFNADITSNVKFTRVDNHKNIELVYDPSSISPHPMLSSLMQKMIQNIATDDEKIKFKNLWQQRVKEIFENIEKVIKVLGS